ncbi:prepilin-type N-terminal cleavage/methylation domain-containing protein [Halioglobus japonicus]|uniref:Prepilin-type N-terminal cleavage/methylation domain-containing protein n=1 Tax=Halioglobus japonicus TaxID=930805 RepID=A0AAP8MHV2_9GAMM|nr:pilin [Halioglobus japonicus]PLW88108.1 prepilin-type N-terminal cleavage/methylation domain-containing protein [Halioglobus japonicus]
MQKKQQGFTLIELMIVIAIVGILAAIALPAYQDYTIRARMSEPMAYMSELKTSVAEYYSALGDVPVGDTQAGVGDAPDTEITTTVSYYAPDDSSDPVIYAVVKGSVFPDGDSRVFHLSGTVSNAAREIFWKCKPGDPSGATDGADTDFTSDTNWLPATCRG